MSAPRSAFGSLLRSAADGAMLWAMETPRFQSFEEFWPYYVKEHSKKGTRILHFVGTTAALACIAGGLFTKRRWLLALAPIVGYGGAWIGHFGIEKNRPATFKHPLYSLRGDFVMWSKMIRGKMGAEVERIMAEDRKRSEPAPAPVEAAPRAPETVN